MSVSANKKLFQRITQYRPNRLFFYILACFLSLVLLIAAIGVFYSVYSYKARQSDYEAKAIQSQLAASALCSGYLRPAMELNSNELNHFLIKRYLRPYTKASIEQKLELALIPVILNNNSNLAGGIVDEHFLYNDDVSVFTVNGIVDFSLFLKKYYDYTEYDLDFFRQYLDSYTPFLSLPPTRIHRYYQNQSSIVLPIISSEYINGHNTVSITNINLSQLSDMLHNANSFTGTRFMLLNNMGELLLSSDEGLTEPASALISQKQQIFLDDGSLYAEVDNTSYFVSYTILNDFGWQYYCFTPIRQLIQKNSQIISTTILFCFILVIFGIALSFLFAFKIYNPIRNIRSIIEKNISLDKKNNRSFEKLIRSEANIDTLVDRYYDMLNTKKIGFELSLLASVIQDKILCSKESFTLMLHDNYDFSDPYYSCNVIKFCFNDIFYEEMDEQMQITVCQTLKLLINEYTLKLGKSLTMELGDGMYVNILNLKTAEAYDAITDCFKELLQVFNYDSGYYNVAIGLGTIKNSAVLIPASYDDAMTAIEYKCTHSVLLSRACDMEISHTIHYSLATEKKIIGLFEKGDRTGLRNTINGIVSEHAAHFLSWRRMHSLLKQIYNSASLKKENAPNLFDEMQIGCTLDEKVGMLLNAYESLISTGLEEGSGEKVLISAIRQYVDAHYGEDISLVCLSEKLGYNYKYVSRIFKEYTGYNLSDYINIVRIAKAKGFIEDSGMNIKEIQTKIGIPSRTTFNRIFKKYEGVPPSKYRELNTYNKILDFMDLNPEEQAEKGT